MIANKADIIAHESLGYSHVVYKGESYFVNFDSESSRLKFKEYLENETGKEWCVAKLERYVLYRKDMYGLVLTDLRLNDTFRGKVEIPINTVSCKCMFSFKSLDGIDFSDFDTSGIENMREMFYSCTFPEDFSLGNKFDTARVMNMCEMFSNCTFPKGFSLGDKFDTARVKDMSYMFKNCTFPEGFSLGDKFDTSSVKNMYSMFDECTFPEGFNLGDKFDIFSVENMTCMFYGTQFNEDFSLARNFIICDKAEYVFFDAKLPSRVAKQLSGEVTDREIVELLKLDLVNKADFF